MRTRDVPDEDATDVGSRWEPSDPTPDLCIVTTSPDRLIFSEPDNPDGWIATDYTVALER